MKNLFVTMIALMAFATSSFAQLSYSALGIYNTPKTSEPASIYSGTNSNVRYQSGYTRSNGTYVQGHYKTTQNDTNWDNFSTKSNSNPFTGSQGTRARDYSLDALKYGSGSSIQTGPRGGQYYMNSNGNKTYVPKRRSSTGW